jgi:hypothetical protein
MNINDSIKTLTNLIDDNETIGIQSFANKLALASEQYPSDKTLGTMASIVSRMSTPNKLFISRAEIKDLYNKLYSRNTKFAELFKDELGTVEVVSKPTIYNRENEDESGSVITKAYERVVDPTLANALNAAFGTITKTYNSVQADAATNICGQKLSFTNSTIAAVSGRDGIVICRATFETPKGQTSFFVPVEVVAETAFLPDVFIGNGGPEDFTKENVEEYIKTNAGVKLSINDSLVLDAALKIKSVDISGVDLALTKLNAAKETTADFSQGQVLFQKVASAPANVVIETPEYNDKEAIMFADAFSSAGGVAKYKFGAKAVASGKERIVEMLKHFGEKNCQVGVCDCNDTGVVYAVSLNGGKVAFKVPINIENGRTSEPCIMISNGGIESFSVAGLKRLYSTDAMDNKVAAVSSPVYGLKPSELVDIVRVAISEENYSKAEDALNVLAESGDERAYQTAFVDYTNGLSGKVIVESTCSMIVSSPSSTQQICGHTGLPLNKVAQDKNNNCVPLYRKGMDDTYEGKYFMNSKIFF